MTAYQKMLAANWRSLGERLIALAKLVEQEQPPAKSESSALSREVYQVRQSRPRLETDTVIWFNHRD